MEKKELPTVPVKNARYSACHGCSILPAVSRLLGSFSHYSQVVKCCKSSFRDVIMGENEFVASLHLVAALEGTDD
jgi:hypothetical protein